VDICVDDRNILNSALLKTQKENNVGLFLFSLVRRSKIETRHLFSLEAGN